MMKEAFLHYIWENKTFDVLQLYTSENKPVEILHVGTKNQNSGPDFFNARLVINHQKWAGNVEIHLKSSDWYAHHHELDSNYDNVILHVVWEHDVEVFRKDNTKIPTLQIRDFIKPHFLDNYKGLIEKDSSWINCESQFPEVNSFLLENWLERLYVERLEDKSNVISELLKISQNNWEAVLFVMLSKNFGLKVNADAFMSMAQSFDFSVLRKQSTLISIEALLFGQSKLLDEHTESDYFNKLAKEYAFLKTKFNLSNIGVVTPQFFRLRPANFPTIRLSQLANLYAREKGLFSKVINVGSLERFYELFSVGVSPFWETHFTFKKSSKAQQKKLSKTFIDLLIQ